MKLTFGYKITINQGYLTDNFTRFGATGP